MGNGLQEIETDQSIHNMIDLKTWKVNWFHNTRPVCGI